MKKIYLSLSIGVLVMALIVAACNTTPPPVAPQSIGVTRFNSDVTVNGLLTASNAKVLGNVDVVGTISAAAVVSSTTPTFSTVTTSGNIVDGGTLDVTGVTTLGGATSSAGALTIGGGYGDTGCTFSAAGVLQCNGAGTIDGAVGVGAGLTVGGGYGSTGCTLSTAGVLQCNGAATIDGATTSTGLLNANAGIAVDTDKFTVADTSGNVNTAGTLSIGGFPFSGAVRGGTAATYTSGAAITHGFASAPAWCLFQPVRDVTSTLTIGATTFSSDTATRATPIYWVCGM